MYYEAGVDVPCFKNSPSYFNVVQGIHSTFVERFQLNLFNVLHLDAKLSSRRYEPLRVISNKIPEYTKFWESKHKNYRVTECDNGSCMALSTAQSAWYCGSESAQCTAVLRPNAFMLLEHRSRREWNSNNSGIRPDTWRCGLRLHGDRDATDGHHGSRVGRSP